MKWNKIQETIVERSVKSVTTVALVGIRHGDHSFAACWQFQQLDYRVESLA
jgi:hypothetical protein